MTRVLVVGLDGLDWELVSRWLPELPAIGGLAARGAYGPLQSIVQPVTPPAWTSMVSGRNPGHFGFTDFTARRPGGYAAQQLVHSGLVRTETVFDVADRAGLSTVALSVPVSYPPQRRRHGAVLSCLMAPSAEHRVIEPAHLKARWLERIGSPLLFDVTARDPDVAGDADALAAKLRRLDDQRFDLALELARGDGWELAFLVCTGTDRVAHYFMHHHDERHVAHPDEPEHADTIRAHYRHCDARLGELLEAVGQDTVVLVVSDHGVQRLDGKLNLNDWLASVGFLRLEATPERPCQLADAPVDWSATRAWASGFGGQVFLNRRGSYPAGTLSDADADAVADELVAGLAGLTDDDGRPIAAEVFRAEDLYRGPYARLCPDLCLQLDGLRVLTRNSVGNARLLEPPGGAAGNGDMASHRGAGFLAIAGPGVPAAGHCRGLSIYDVAPTLLDLFDLDGVEALDGRSLLRELGEVYTSDDEARLSSRLEALYLD